MLAQIVTWGVIPVLVASSLALGVAGLDGGYPPAIVVATVTFGAALVLLVLERVHPYLRAWNRPREDVRTDFLHLFLSMLPVPELFKAFFGGLLASAAGALSHAVGSGLWPSHWPILAELGLALVVAELGQYWVHRLSHETELLWRVHAVHHSARRLYWLNAGRFHPLDVLLQYAAEVTPLIVLGAGAHVLALFAVFTGVNGMLKHMNVHARIGRLNWVFSMAELHRWHHSLDLSEANNNYGSNLIIFDVLFGTRFFPAGRRPPAEIGIADMLEFPTGYLEHLLVPFRWGTVKAGSRGDAAYSVPSHP